jgi:acetyltransferase-like isoleucine patch superfamily enzyme
MHRNQNKTNGMSLVLGRHSYSCDYKITFSAPDNVVRVGNFSSLGPNLDFVMGGNHNMDFASTFPFLELLHCNCPTTGWFKPPPSVGHDVWIGRNVVIYAGVRVGNGAVVAGESVVTKNVPDYALVGGNPARVIRYRFVPEVISDLLESAWWDLDDSFVLTRLVPLLQDPPAFARTAVEERRRRAG